MYTINGISGRAGRREKESKREKILILERISPWTKTYDGFGRERGAGKANRDSGKSERERESSDWRKNEMKRKKRTQPEAGGERKT